MNVGERLRDFFKPKNRPVPPDPLTQSINEITDTVREAERMKRTFGRYVTPQVADAILAGDVKLGGEQKHVTAVFIASSNIDAATQGMNPVDKTTLLNKYYPHVLEPFIVSQGTVDRLEPEEGGAKIIFNSPVSLEDHEARAVTAAVAFQEGMAEFNQQRKAAGEEPILEFTVGIDTGKVVAGNIGSDKRTEYTVVGEPVGNAKDIALTTRSAEKGVFISEATYYPAKDVIIPGATEESSVLTRHGPVTVFEVKEIYKPKPRRKN